MGNPVYVSYSGASRYKQCPTKYFLSKKYQDVRVSSSFPFGKAVEAGVSSLLEGKTLEEAKQRFQSNWETEHVKGNEFRQVFDNLDLNYYASDFDANLVDLEDRKILDDWAAELLDEKQRSWDEVFDGIKMSLDNNRSVTDSELAFYNRVMWTCCLIRGETMIQAFNDQILPKLDLTKTEHFSMQREVSMSNDQGDKIVGYIDFVVFHRELGWIILDLKTAGTAYTQHALDTSEQLRTYVAAIGPELKSLTAGYAVLLKKIKVDRSCDACGAKRESGTAKKCKVCGKGEYTKATLRGESQLMLKAYTDADLDDLVDDYMNVATAIANNVNFKNPGSCFNYGRPCEFIDICWKQKDPSQIQYLESKQVAIQTTEEGEAQ